MFNLLPENLRKKIKSDYSLRRIVVIFIFIIFIQVCAIVALSPSWVVSFYREKELSAEINKVNANKISEDVKGYSELVSNINTKVDIINNSIVYPKATPFLEKIIGEKGVSIYINEITYSVDTSKKASVTLKGVASEREPLLAFVRRLEASKLFSKVDLPISNFAKDKNIVFSVFLTIEI